MFECPNCAYNLKFDIATQQMKCDACESVFDPYAMEKEVDAQSSEYYNTNVFTCPQCEGQINSDDTEAATFCLFCGSSTILTERISKEKRPNYIIPFQKTKEDCKEAYLKKMRRAYFVPDEYKKAEFIDGFKGVYMPYWSYCFSKEGDISLTGTISDREGDYIVIEKYKLTGNLSMEVNGDSYDAATSFFDDISMGLEPYEFEDRKDFTPGYLSGFYADSADVSYEMNLQKAEDYAREELRVNLQNDEGFKKYNLPGRRDLPINLDIRADRTLYPVWFLSYRNGDRVSYATVNGQTGKVVADLPMDKKKFLIGSLVLAIPIFVLLNMSIILNFKDTLALGLYFLFLSLDVYASELRTIFEKENLWHDKSILYQSRDLRIQKRKIEEEYENAPGSLFLSLLGIKFSNGWEIPGLLIFFSLFVYVLSNVTRSTLWPVMAFFTFLGVRSVWGQILMLKRKKNPPAVIVSLVTLLAVVAVFLLKPVHDAWYYGMTMITLIAVVVNFFHIINDYNHLAMRKLPQFYKIGGDDCA